MNFKNLMPALTAGPTGTTYRTWCVPHSSKSPKFFARSIISVMRIELQCGASLGMLRVNLSVKLRYKM